MEWESVGEGVFGAGFVDSLEFSARRFAAIKPRTAMMVRRLAGGNMISRPCL
jgi:hypothetical protein